MPDLSLPSADKTCVVQAAGSWSVDACCAVHGNDCRGAYHSCYDRASSSDWLFGLWPGPPQRFEPTGTDAYYQTVRAGWWPVWGYGFNGHTDLSIGWDSGAPGGVCQQGGTYRGTDGEICGGDYNWGATDVEVWYPR